MVLERIVRDLSQEEPTLSSALRHFVRNFSVEMLEGDLPGAAACTASLQPGAEVYLRFAPGESCARLVASAEWLQKAGLVPVPHVVARDFTTYTQLARFLAELHDIAGVDRRWWSGATTTIRPGHSGQLSICC